MEEPAKPPARRNWVVDLLLFCVGLAAAVWQFTEGNYYLVGFWLILVCIWFFLAYVRKRPNA